MSLLLVVQLKKTLSLPLTVKLSFEFWYLIKKTKKTSSWLEQQKSNAENPACIKWEFVKKKKSTKKKWTLSFGPSFLSPTSVSYRKEQKTVKIMIFLPFFRKDNRKWWQIKKSINFPNLKICVPLCLIFQFWHLTSNPWKVKLFAFFGEKQQSKKKTFSCGCVTSHMYPEQKNAHFGVKITRKLFQGFFEHILQFWANLDEHNQTKWFLKLVSKSQIFAKNVDFLKFKRL